MNGEQLKVWRLVGFGTAMSAASSIDLSLNQAGLVTKLRLKPPSEGRKARTANLRYWAAASRPRLRQLLRRTTETCFIDHDSGLRRCLGASVRAGLTVSRPAADLASESRLPPLPPFAQGAGARDAAALPVMLGGTVAAVLYADAPAGETTADSRGWPAALNALARHASRVLEAMTVRRATRLPLPSLPPARQRRVADLSPLGSMQ